MRIMRMVMIVLALILISCKKEIAPKPPVKTVDSVKVENKIFITEVDSNELFVYRLVSYAKNDSTPADSEGIEIFNKANGNLIQRIDKWGHFNIDRDFNFDGVPDLLIKSGNYPAETNEYWIYNTQKLTYLQDTGINDGPSLNTILDTANKLLIFEDTKGMGTHYQWAYNFVDGKAEKVFEKYVQFATDSNKDGKPIKSYYLLNHTFYENGKAKEIKKFKVSPDSEYGFDPSDYPQKKRKN